MASAEAPYTARQLEKLVGLSRAFIRSLAAAGVLAPQEGDRFTLQDLVVLRTARGLRDARVSHRKIVQALKNVRGTLAQPRHLASVRLRSNGRSVEVIEAEGSRDALSGQMLLPLEDAGALRVSESPPSPARDAKYWFQQAVRLEASDLDGAETSYRRAIFLEPCMGIAYVNLGAMLCEAKRCQEAVALYDDAIGHCGDIPLVHFNRGTALEDSGRPALAIEAYKRTLELDPSLADAHYNLAVLMERLGDTQASLRHFSTYRRLHRDGTD